MPEPVVTVAIPSYECERYVGAAIESALSQDFEALEVLIVDDASTDGTREVIGGFADPRVRVLYNDRNVGPGRTWNRLLAEARGRYVCVMGCDDVLLPGSVAAQVAVMEAEPQVVIVTGQREIITERGRVIMRRGNGGLSGTVPGAEAGSLMVRKGTNLVGEPCAALVRMSAIGQVGGFDEGNPYTIDMDLWLRLLEVGDLHVLARPTCQYRILPGSWSAKVASSQEADVRQLVSKTAARGAFGTTEADARAGARRAQVLAFGRRVVYRALFDLEMRQRLLYLVVGGWNTLFGYLAFSGLYFLLHARLDYVPIFVASYAVSMLNAYWGYKLAVFRSKGKFHQEFPRFAIVYVIALGVNLVVFPWLTRTLGLNPYVSQAVFTVALVICTYVVNRQFTFRQRGV